MSANPATSARAKRCPQCHARFPVDFRVCPRDATPLQDAPEDGDPLLGVVLSNSYEVVRVIGEGGMGRVYEAVHQRLRNRRYAVKVLHQEHARQPDVVSRFLREAEAASALDHPNVLEVYDVDRTPDGRPYIVSELLQGEELGRHLDRLGRLPAADGIGIVRQLCHALAAAHARGVVHRDMKPENVFLVGEGSGLRAKILDFGISKVGDSKGTLTQTGVVIGTPAYMPPEQARGTHVDHRADIYAVGAILYRTLTGAKPFSGRDVAATLAAVVTDEPVRPSTLEHSITPGLELVIQKAMAKNPDERYGSFAELEAALAEHAAAAAPALPASEADAGAGSEHTLLLDPSVRSGSSHSIDTRDAGGARSSLVMLSLGGAVWLVLGAIDAFASSVRLTRGGAPVTASEITLSVVGAAALLTTPAIFWTRHLVKRIWPSTPRAVEAAARLRTALTASFAAYGGCALLGHVVATLRASEPGPGWSLLAYVLGVSALVAAFGLRRPRG